MGSDEAPCRNRLPHCRFHSGIAALGERSYPIARTLGRQGLSSGLAGEEIPLLSRILAIVDAYDAMTHERPYREAVSHAKALAELERCAGTQFDPDLVAVFVEQLEQRVVVAVE